MPDSGLARHRIEGSAQRRKRRRVHKHINMIEAGYEFDREIRLRWLKQRRIAIGIELVIVGACDEYHRLLGALEGAIVVTAVEIHRQPKGIDARQAWVAGRK
jgi:hypothetical protein